MRKLKLLLTITALLLLGGISVNAQLTNGTVYWIQDISTGQFISQGDAWATRAVTQDVGGLGFEAVYVSDGVYKLNNVMWNTVKNATLGLGVDLYVDQTPAEWIITSSGDGYTIKNGDNYLVNNGSENAYKEKPIGKTTDAAAATVWKFLTKTEYDAAIQVYKDSKAAAYAVSLGYDEVTSVSALETLISNEEEFKSKDYTSSINNPTLGSNDSGWSHGRLGNRGNDAGGWTVGNGCAEFWNGCGYATQTVSGLPNGLYKVTFVGSYRPENSDPSNNLVSGKTSSPAFVYANDAKIEFLHWIDVPAKANGRGGITVENGYQNSFYTYVTDGTLALGIVADGWTGGYNWTTFGQFTLTQYYSVASFKKAYNEALTAATDASDALDGFTLYATQKSTLDGIITANTLTGDDLSDIDKLTEATINLNNASLAVAAEVANCKKYVSIVSTINGGTNVDLTSFITNPSFENGLTGWTNTGNMVTQGNTSFGKTGNNYVEFWQPNGTKGLSQTISLLPSGLYEVSVKVKARGVTSAKVFAGGNEKAVKIADEENIYIVSFAVDDKVQATIGFEGVGTGAGSSWFALDNFTLKYVGELPDVEAVTGKMNATVAQAQTDAIATYNSEKTAANYNAAVNAIAAAQASKNAYEHLGAAITKIDAALAAATTATETDDEAYQTIKTAYNNGTIENADIQTNINNAYDAVIAIIKSQTATSADFTMAIKNQSFEYGDMTGWTATASSDTGIRETSNATYAATGTDGYYLFNTYWQGVPLTQAVTGLPNGQYTLTASVSSDGATIYLIANGEHNDGIETGGEYPSKDVMQETTFTFLVKDGIATIGVVGGADGTAGEHKDYVAEGYWWYKADNFRLVKNRDLTPEEAAIVPEDLSIQSTATVFINKTTTLVPTSTTEDASIEGFVNWTSDNTSVATVSSTGVVTAVAYGTANITVTSTLNAQATATCAVTVTAPLYNEAENLDFAEGPVIDNHICTYEADMTKPENNTTYCHTQPVTGWTITSTDTDGKAAGVMTYASSTGMGNNSVCAPATNPDGETTGNVFGMVGVWSGSIQYVQPVKLPAGKYTITVPVYRNGGATALTKNLIGFVEDSGTEHFAATTVYADKTWTTETIEIIIAKETYGKLSLGLNSPNKGSNDCQRLWIDRIDIAYEPLATTEDYDALNEAINAAEAKKLGFDEGEYAPYNNIEALNLLAAAKAIDQEANNVQSTVQAATAALEAASWSAANTEEMNAIYDGTFAAATNNGAPAGWRMSNNTLGGDLHSRAFVGDNRLVEFNDTKSGLFLRFDGTNSNRGSMYYYGDTEGYTMPLDADTYYRVTVDFAGWGSTGKPLQMNVTGPEGFTTVSQQYTTSVRADNADNAPQQFNIMFKTVGAGNYVINFQTPGADSNTHNVVISNVVLKKALENITIAEGETYTPALKYANVTFNRTLVQGWNGLVLPFDMTVENVATTFKASKVKNFIGITYDPAKGVTLNFDNFAAETVIPAGTPFLVKAAAGTSYTINGVVLPANGLQNITKTADGNGKIKYTMKGTHAASTNLTDVSFALIQGNTFFYHDGAAAKASSAKAFRAYFENESEESDAARVSFDFGDDETTGITELAQPKTAADGTYYDLQGRKVENFKQKGIYIVNGRKVVK